MPTIKELAGQELAQRYSRANSRQVAPRPQTMQNVRPNVRSALSNLMRDAVDATGLGGGYRQGLLNMAGDIESAVDFAPVLGDAIAVDEAAQAYGRGDMLGAGINMMSVVPIIGDAGVKLSKKARSALRDQGFTEGFFHASKQDIQDGFKAGYNDGMVFVTPERGFANNWVGKGKYQQRLGEENIDDMRRADRQKLWDEYESQYGSYENWPSEIEDEYNKRSINLTQQYQASGGAIYPVAVKANKQFDPEENPEVISEFLKSQGRDPNATTIVSGKTDLEAYQEGNYLFYENKEMADFLKDKGYDSVWLREDTTKSGLSKPFSTLAVLDEKGVKPVYDFAREADVGDVAAKGAKTARSALNNLLDPARTPEKVQTAYKLFRTDPEGNLYPLFVNANQKIPVGEWLPAEAGEMTGEKVKSKIGALAYRPGWHAGDLPIATHIGEKYDPQTLLKDKAMKAPNVRPDNQVWAEVEMPADYDWQTEAMNRAQRSKAGNVIPRTAHITDQVPYGGFYRYKTNPNMTGEWLIGGQMKVNRILGDDEVRAVNEAAGVSDLPRLSELQAGALGGSDTLVDDVMDEQIRKEALSQMDPADLIRIANGG